MNYRIVIDRNACSGFGSCVETAPASFALGDDGIAVATAGADELDVLLVAARDCPMGAISIVDADGRPLR